MPLLAPAHGSRSELKPRQFTLRAVLLVVTVVPPLVGGLCGALGPHVQLWLLMALGIPAVSLAMLGLTFALCYVIFVLPVLMLAKAAETLYSRLARRGGQD